MPEEQAPLQPVSTGTPHQPPPLTGGAQLGAAPEASQPQSTVARHSSSTHAMHNKPAKGDGLFSALKDVLPVLTIYSFFAGWIYAFSFYKAFRVPVSTLDIPFQYFFMYSFSALATWRGISVILVATACVALLRRHRFVMLAVASSLFLVLFGVAFFQGTSDANTQRYGKTNDRILLSFTEQALKSLPSDLSINNQKERLRLLTETKERLLVFYQPQPIAPGELSPALVYDVAKSNVVTITRQVSDKQSESVHETLWRIIHE